MEASQCLDLKVTALDEEPALHKCEFSSHILNSLFASKAAGYYNVNPNY